MGQLKFEWIFENGQFVGRRVVMVLEESKEKTSIEAAQEQEIYPKAS